MTRAVYTTDVAQAHGILALVRWFDVEASSLHHALVMAAEHNEADARQVDESHPAIAWVLRESAQSWRTHAKQVLDLHEGLGDVEDLDANPF